MSEQQQAHPGAAAAPGAAAGELDAALLERQRCERLEQQQRAEQALRARQQQERLERRAELLASILQAFLGRHQQAALAERRPAAGSKAGGNKEGKEKAGGKVKGGKQEEEGKGGKGKQAAAAQLSPVVSCLLH